MATERSSGGGDETGGGGRRGRGQRGAFYLVGAVYVLVMAVFVGELILRGLLAWFVPVGGTHRLHDLMLAEFVLVGTAGVLLQAAGPRKHVAAMQTVVLSVLALTVMNVATGGSGIEPGTFLVLGGLLALLHPSGRALLDVGTGGAFDRRLAALVAIAAVPLLAFAADQTALQVASSDGHAALQHYSDQAAYAVTVLLVGLLAALRTRGWWFAALAAGWLALAQGVPSMYVSVASSVGPFWGGLEALWGLAFLAVAAHAYRSGAARTAD